MHQLQRGPANCFPHYPGAVEAASLPVNQADLDPQWNPVNPERASASPITCFSPWKKVGGWCGGENNTRLRPKDKKV